MPSPRRVVIDPNVWISALISPFGAPAQVLRAVLAGGVIAVVSPRLVEELSSVLARPKFRRWVGRRQQLERDAADIVHDGLQCGHHVGPEQRGVVVAPVQGQPRDGRFVRPTRAKPLREQARLAEAGRRGQDRERLLGRRLSEFSQPLAADPTRPPARQAILATQERTWHRPALPTGDAIPACTLQVPWCTEDRPLPGWALSSPSRVPPVLHRPGRRTGRSWEELWHYALATTGVSPGAWLDVVGANRRNTFWIVRVTLWPPGSGRCCPA